MANKMPVTQLQELCMKRKHGPPIYTLTIDGTSQQRPQPSEPSPSSDASAAAAPSIFAYQVDAFDHVAEGQGKNKKLAKHEAALQLLLQLRRLPEFADELANVAAMPPSTGGSAADTSATGFEQGDAVCKLLDICVQRDWPIAQFTVQQAYGTAHAPAFSVECRLASLVRVGTFSTKKGAKQLAAQEMLRVVQTLPQDEHEQQIARRLEEDRPEHHMKTYRELRHSDIKSHTGTKLCDRHRFFERMAPADKERWRRVFEDVRETAMEKVHMLCRSMGWVVKVSAVPEHPDARMRVFELQNCNYDVVLAGREPELWDEVLTYFGMMSGVAV